LSAQRYDGDVFAFDESSVIQALPKGIDSICEAGSQGASEKSNQTLILTPPLIMSERDIDEMFAKTEQILRAKSWRRE